MKVALPDGTETSPPDGLALVPQGAGFEIVRRWLSWSAVYGPVISVVLLGAYLGKLLPTDILGQDSTSNTPVLLFLLVAGVAMAYTCLAGLCNRTIISADQGRITVRHAPLPCFGNFELDGTTLKQLYSKLSNGSVRAYEVRAITQSGKDVLVVDGLRTHEQSRYVEQKLEQHLKIEHAALKTLQLDIDLPRWLQVFDQGSGVEIVWRWPTMGAVAITVFAIFWNVFVFGFMFSDLLSPRVPVGIRLVLLLFTILGLGLIYLSLAAWCNRTVLAAGSGRLTMQNRPLPPFRKIDLEGSTLKQFYAKERIDRSRSTESSTETTTVVYEVRVTSRDGKDRLLLSNLPTMAQALFIEKTLERYFRVEDAPVQGEFDA